jgi:3-deoxy-7-phosphoheptulonate synthase
MAAVAAGANGLLIEVHVDPKRALSDKQQALSLDEFIRLNKKLQNLKAYLNSNETNQ